MFYKRSDDRLAFNLEQIVLVAMFLGRTKVSGEEIASMAHHFWRSNKRCTFLELKLDVLQGHVTLEDNCVILNDDTDLKDFVNHINAPFRRYLNDLCEDFMMENKLTTLEESIEREYEAKERAYTLILTRK